ncbi:MAG: hypothetical protein ACAI34_07380, partial [Verrucomicrobium sp.]
MFLILAGCTFFVSCGILLAGNFITLVSADKLSRLNAILTLVAVGACTIFVSLKLHKFVQLLISKATSIALTRARTALATIFLPQGNSFTEHFGSETFGNASKELFQSVRVLSKLALEKFLSFILIAATGTIFATVLALIHFVLANLQVTRVTEQNVLLAAQNNLLSTQNDLLVSNSRIGYQTEEAAIKLSEIRSVLLDSNAAIESQLYALKGLPEAMVLPVRRDADKIDYPNLLPLKALLVEYMRFDRIGQRLRTKGIRWDIYEPLPEGVFTELLDFGPISTEVLKALHRLGNLKDGRSVWNFTPDGKSVAPALKVLKRSELNIKQPLMEFRGEAYAIDLRHLPKDAFHRAQLPCAMRGSDSGAVFFAPGTEFDRCHFEGWFLLLLSAENAEFRNSRLDHVRIKTAKLNGSTFVKTTLDGTEI